MKKTVVKISVNKRKLPPVILDQEVPNAAIFIENEDFSAQQAEGLTDKENYIEVLCRSAEVFFQSAMNTLTEIEELDPVAAAELWAAFYLSDTEGTNDQD